MIKDNKGWATSKNFEEMFRKEYQLIHDTSGGVGKMIGEQIVYHVWDIQRLTDEHPGTTILDFGCGKCYGYLNKRIHKLWNYKDIILYDIGIEKYSKKPEQSEFQSVVSVDVLEHIPQEQIDEVFKYWYHANTEFVFATIAAYPARAELSDGTNAHVNQNEWAWWQQKIKKHITCHSKFVYMPTRHPKDWQTYEFKK